MQKHWIVLGCTALVTGSLLSGCASKAPEPPAPAPAPPAAQAPAAQDKPGKLEGELIVVTAKVKAVNKKDRIVTLKYSDGQERRIKCGPEVRNFAQIHVGDDVKAEFLETAELFIADSPEKPATDMGGEVVRAPKGSKPGVVAVDSIEVKATVQAIDYQNREVVLQGPEGKMMKIKAGPEVKRLDEVHQGDTVVARLTRAVSIQVTTPAKK